MPRDYIIRRTRQADADQEPDGRLSLEEVRELLDYTKATGEFVWRERGAHLFAESGWGREYSARAWNARYAGKQAGRINEVNGYRYIRLFGRNYLAHRLAWLLTHGAYPGGEVDHINGKRADNRVANLRDIDAQTNRRNQCTGKRNTSGEIGVNFMRSKGKWRAEIMVNRKSIHLGIFETKAEAVAARTEANARYGFHKNHGRAAA